MNVALVKIAHAKVKAWIDYQNQRIHLARERGDHTKADTLTAELHRRLKGGK